MQLVSRPRAGGQSTGRRGGRVMQQGSRVGGERGWGIDARWRYPRACFRPVSGPLCRDRRTDESRCGSLSIATCRVTDRREPLRRARRSDWSVGAFAILRCAGDWLGKVLACSTWQDAGRRDTGPASMDARLTRRLRVGEFRCYPPDLTGAEAPARAAQCGRGSTSRPASAGWGVFLGFHAWVGTPSSRLSTSFRFVSLMFRRSVHYAGEARELPDRSVASDFLRRIQAQMRRPAYWTRSSDLDAG